MIPSSDHSDVNPVPSVQGAPARKSKPGKQPPKAASKPAPESGMRLNRFLASAGLGSRRSCEDHILKGRVSINGSVARDLATRVTEDDDVRISGRVIHAIAPPDDPSQQTLRLHDDSQRQVCRENNF